MKRLGGIIYGFFAVATAMIGYHIHGSVFWSIVDFFCTFLAWAKWLLCHEVSLSVIRETFSFFLN